PDMTVSEAQKASEIVQKTISPNARIIWGANIDPTMQATIRVLLVVTGVKSPQILGASSARSHGSRAHEHEIETVR
ncbi:cell division protein FtsZ, partial [mine drainage metagenome]